MNLLTLLYLKGNFVDIQPASYHYDAGRICKWMVLDFAPFCLHPEVPRSFVGKSATDDASFAGPRAVAWTTDCTSAFLYAHSITDWKLSAICCRAETHFPKYQILLYCQRSRQYYRIFFKAPVQMALKQSICKSHWYFLNYPQRIHHVMTIWSYKHCFVSVLSTRPHPHASAGPPHSWGLWWTCWWGGFCSPPAAERSGWAGPELLLSRRPPPAPAPVLTQEKHTCITI